MVLAEPTHILHGAGRTDAGVHAKAMTAHFHTQKKRTIKSIHNGLNSLLPKDIRILNCEEVDLTFHARFNAKAKIYSYHIFQGIIQPPTERLYATHVPLPLDVDKMRLCLNEIIGTHDFSSFEAAGSRDMTCTTGKGAIRTIKQASIEQKGHNLIIVLQGDGFLRHMVRNIVGTLIEVGKNKRSVQNFSTVLAAKDRAQGGSTAPAHGLFLEQVLY